MTRLLKCYFCWAGWICLILRVAAHKWLYWEALFTSAGHYYMSPKSGQTVTMYVSLCVLNLLRCVDVRCHFVVSVIELTALNCINCEIVRIGQKLANLSCSNVLCAAILYTDICAEVSPLYEVFVLGLSCAALEIISNDGEVVLK